MKNLSLPLALLLPLLLSACSSTAPIEMQKEAVAETSPQSEKPEQETSTKPETSTLDSYNEAMHSFNEAAYDYVLNPLGTGLEYITPDFVEDSVSSILENLSVPNTAINNALQGKFKSSGQDLARFGINTTVGLLGIIDWASMIGLPKNEEDLGQTLAVYGVGAGPHVVIPVFGVATPRDMLGMFASFDPVNMTDDSTKSTFDNLGYASMLWDSSGSDAYPTLEKQKQLFTAYRNCSIHDGADIAKDSCDQVCTEFSSMIEKELEAAENPEEKQQMIEMAPSFVPSYCKIDFTQLGVDGPQSS